MQLSSPKSSPKAFLSTHFVPHSASKSISVISTFYLVQWPPCFVPTGSELFITLPELDCYDFIDGLQSQSVLILSDTFINLQFLVAQEFVFSMVIFYECSTQQCCAPFPCWLRGTVARQPFLTSGPVGSFLFSLITTFVSKKEGFSLQGLSPRAISEGLV